MELVTLTSAESGAESETPSLETSSQKSIRIQDGQELPSQFGKESPTSTMEVFNHYQQNGLSPPSADKERIDRDVDENPHLYPKANVKAHQSKKAAQRRQRRKVAQARRRRKAAERRHRTMTARAAQTSRQHERRKRKVEQFRRRTELERVHEQSEQDQETEQEIMITTTSESENESGHEDVYESGYESGDEYGDEDDFKVEPEVVNKPLWLDLSVLSPTSLSSIEMCYSSNDSMGSEYQSSDSESTVYTDGEGNGKRLTRTRWLDLRTGQTQTQTQTSTYSV